MKIKLFYSYSHKNTNIRDEIEKTLVLLRREGLLHEWHDTAITPGTSISEAIKKNLENSDIYLFLFSSDFIASDPCVDEWKRVRELSKSKTIYRVPIILEPCSWQDFLDGDDVKALPSDGAPINTHSDKAVAFQEIYEGIKSIIEKIRSTYTAKNDFIEELRTTDFLSQNAISLEDIFVFPNLIINKENESSVADRKIKDCTELLERDYQIIKGEEDSGKTALCKFLTLHLIQQYQPVIYINLSGIENKKPNENIFKECYEKQFNGDYSLWKKRDTKITIIFDELLNSRKRKEHVLFAKKLFRRVLVSVTSDQYDSFFYDDEDLADFTTIQINELSHVQTEELIKKRLFKVENNINYKTIDDVENKVNQVVNDGFLERYPFVILSVLQTFEAYMPSNLEITSYGHCYRALVIAQLIKSGIGSSDSELVPCFNFLEHLAYAIFKNKKDYSYKLFIEKYNEEFVIKNTSIHKLTHANNGLEPFIKNQKISHKYAYYFFLGSYLAKNQEHEKNRIEDLIRKNYIKDNNRILLFLLHHSTDADFIETVILESMCAFDNVPEATLNIDETKNIFEKIIENLPTNIQSQKPIDEERKIERNNRDRESVDKNRKKEEDYEGSIESVNNLYKILKNNELLGQVLRNHHGNIKKDILKQIIETIIGSGLRLTKLFLNAEGIEELVNYIKLRKKEQEIERIRDFCQFLCFRIVMNNIEKVVHLLSVDEIQEILKDLDFKRSPAYELIEYFTLLDTCNNYSNNQKNKLKDLYEKHTDNVFIKKIISLRTQYYFNTHKVDHKIKQSVSHMLHIPYKG